MGLSHVDLRPRVNYGKTATVAVGGTTSGEVDLGDEALVGIFTPSTMEGTTITLTAAPAPGGTFVAVQDGDGSSSSFTVTTAASRYVPLDSLAILAGLRFIKLVCGSTQTTTDTVFTLATRPI
jgi:hypothetical protein